ncbi:LPXTG cell wall anchor domain-containing protein [Brevibacterium sp. UCMA 11754]|uniref:LPXTG cell wall anchor domain-containing protein n=1 Tax=Brevibacterium sp. UCMA 11754 TaxID=2749198 RepID=UPI001F39CDEA|nr:LPXTG cell wall anchor domain-containing protein [Brevibacterium sp. UCMA 11754]MCF2572284.1 LPXTG cell wall anchor domain-containing protein [Brevibacterium sp. UCMA 11754]
MKTSRLVLAPAVAVALTGLAGAPAFAATASAPVPAGPLCAHEDAQQSTDPDSKVPDSSDPQATLSDAQVTRADIADRKKGIGFSGTGFTPDSKATVTVVGTDGSKYSPETKLTVDEKGKVSGTYFFSVTDNAKVPSGEYSLYLTDEKTEKDSSKVSFEVVASDSDIDEDAKGSDCSPATGAAPDPSETATDEPSETSTPTETKSEEPSEEPTETKEASKPAAPKPTETETKAPEPTETETQAPEPTETESETPEPTETDDKSEAPAPTETESGAPESEAPESDAPESEAPKSDAPKAEPSETTAPASPGTDDGEKKAAATATQALIIDPTEISSEDFLNEGIKLGITGAQPGEKITITVEHAQGKVDRYTMTKEADSEGKATFGVQAKVKAVLGTYNVTAQADSFDKAQGGSFTVVTNGTSVDEGGQNGSDSDSDLPRTGAEMTGLALGVGLLVVGAAAVVITRRRMTASDDPAEF